ncbi:oxygenase MpaB family protein [Streptomyces sp. NPDC058220]|uniref:oxygenase MpaB family protein n=1 Tax=Streptomyces sp. NPDC058220 TaxID=3346387 RepID=UPI0036E15D2C
MDSTAHPDPLSPLRRGLSEWRMALVAWRLLVLQVSHPVVAAGTAEHSTYRAHPWRRIEHTMGSGQRLVCADRDTLRREVARLNRAHKRITGTDEHGRAYSARDPATQAWVLITLYEAIVAMRELSGDPYTPRELAELYAEYRPICEAFGLPEGFLPSTAAEVPAYIDSVVRERLEFGEQARYLLYDMLREAPRPRRPRYLGPVWPLLRLLIAVVVTSLTLADLPPAYRERFGLSGKRRHAWLSWALHHGLRRLATRLPDRWRYRSRPAPDRSAPVSSAPPAERADIPAPRHAARPGRWRRDARGPKLGRFFSQVLDQTGDGFVGAQDLRAMAHNVCWQLELNESGEAEVYAAFDVWWEQLRRAMETDGDGRISKAEFVAATMAHCDRDPDYLARGLHIAVRAVFHAADTDGSGVLDADEYRAVFGPRLHPAELSHGFRQLDQDGDGGITEEEFVRGFTEFFTARTDLAAGSQLLGHP